MSDKPICSTCKEPKRAFAFVVRYGEMAWACCSDCSRKFGAMAFKGAKATPGEVVVGAMVQLTPPEPEKPLIHLAS